MSCTTVKDATGTGKTLKIDDENRAHVFSTSEDQEEHAVIGGKSWNLNTLDLVLSTDTASVTQYIKNTGAVDLKIKRWVVVTGPTTDGIATDNVLIEIIRNPTSVSFSTALTPFNSNFGSSRNPNALVYKGGEGETVTGGDVIISSRVNAGGRNILPVFCTLPQGSSAAIRITPQSGNTNMKVQTVIVAFEA